MTYDSLLLAREACCRGLTVMHNHTWAWHALFLCLSVFTSRMNNLEK